MKFPHYKQYDLKDCGPTCLKIIAKFYNKTIPLQQLRNLTETTRLGSSLHGLAEASEQLGFRSIGVKISLEKLLVAPLPCILHWNKKHFVVLYKIVKGVFYVSDPAHGLLKYSKEEFLKCWIGNNANDKTEEGVVLLLETTPAFYEICYTDKDNKLGFLFLSKYILKYKKFIWQLVIGLIAASALQLVFPFLTQSIVDVGIKNQDIHFVYLILFAQLALFIGRTSIEVIRSWILLHLSTRINISLVSDFFIKLMNLPIAFFDSRMTGDILQRINDHRRIEQVLTTSSLSVLFSTFNLILFSLVLLYYNLQIFGVFIIGSVLYFLWISIFLKKRANLDYKRFSEVSQEQSRVIELISGMQEIKLHNAEKQKRWGWENIQARLFKVSIDGLKLEQYQSVGSNFFNELKNILITILSAKLVIDGEITLGMMLAISYIVGQLNSPIVQLIDFIKEIQDAKISLERLSEIHQKEDEEKEFDNRINEIPKGINFNIMDVSFRYSGSDQVVLNKIDLEIPANKITAIVGVSGSGKTTLMKLLLKFYEPNQGKIIIGQNDLKHISHKHWREKCGVVMQEGYIFSDTIANNIAVGEDVIDKTKLAHAVDIANIKDYIESLPLSYNTKIGMEGIGLSTGQKQRLLIARAVYKNPKFLFFDEATSALDTNNERVIMEKLNTFFKNKTVVVIAHRLSTVKDADQIVVIDNGQIAEVGHHKALVAKKGEYYNLVKNQLELGN
ncbi:peptidase domain-containing ABC transporter [Hyunsoonleella pacifica]|uniref:Peptidase domain-containing ABC transporter n=1 Tax=Hyunsoonleella pacifica TaxID=1080224 RepID=A0A4Q9FL44_9FLAO|nr:peptidase domain-containing ABC transporter [Hyunsoonleella pacifica]TBN13124.1 peptidase domain-containing ABC transporter [Hyunsoonleella pacifica]GGD28360.1 ABC transporter ATP-binding protein [Hyunsoonleella pacifica]